MKNTLRNLTLSAAALAALTVIAPTAAAQDRGRGGYGNAPRQENRSFGRRETPGQAPRQDYRGQLRDDRGHSRAEGYRGNGNRGFENRGFENRGYGNRDYGNRGYGNRGYDNRHYGNRGYGARGYERGRFYAAPIRPFRSIGIPSPFRIFSGFRFYSACPGPDYVYIADYGWVLPPFFGAVWVPAHYDIEGYWVEGFWR